MMFDLQVNQLQSRNLMNSVMKEGKNAKEEFNPNAFYAARVVNTNDPYKLGRVQIRIPSLHGVDKSQRYYLQDSSLPWARPALLQAAGNDMGQFIVPAKGTIVYVTFEYDDRSKPLYFGGVFTVKAVTKTINDNSNIYYGQELEEDSNDRITDLDNKSAQYVIFKSLKGSTIIIDDKDGHESIKIIDAAGQQIVMENNSDATLDRRGNTTNPPDTASISVISNGTINLKCKNLNLDCETTNLKDYV